MLCLLSNFFPQKFRKLIIVQNTAQATEKKTQILSSSTASQTKMDIYHKKKKKFRAVLVFKIIATHKGPPRNKDPPTKGSVHKHLQKLSLSWYKLPAYLRDKCSEQVHIFITEIWNRIVARQTDTLI